MEPMEDELERLQQMLKRKSKQLSKCNRILQSRRRVSLSQNSSYEEKQTFTSNNISRGQDLNTGNIETSHHNISSNPNNLIDPNQTSKSYSDDKEQVSEALQNMVENSLMGIMATDSSALQQNKDKSRNVTFREGSPDIFFVSPSTECTDSPFEQQQQQHEEEKEVTESVEIESGLQDQDLSESLLSPLLGLPVSHRPSNERRSKSKLAEINSSNLIELQNPISPETETQPIDLEEVPKSPPLVSSGVDPRQSLESVCLSPIQSVTSKTIQNMTSHKNVQNMTSSMQNLSSLQNMTLRITKDNVTHSMTSHQNMTSISKVDVSTEVGESEKLKDSTMMTAINQTSEMEVDCFNETSCFPPFFQDGKNWINLVSEYDSGPSRVMCCCSEERFVFIAFQDKFQVIEFTDSDQWKVAAETCLEGNLSNTESMCCSLELNDNCWRIALMNVREGNVSNVFLSTFSENSIEVISSSVNFGEMQWEFERPFLCCSCGSWSIFLSLPTYDENSLRVLELDSVNRERVQRKELLCDLRSLAVRLSQPCSSLSRVRRRSGSEDGIVALMADKIYICDVINDNFLLSVSIPEVLDSPTPSSPFPSASYSSMCTSPGNQGGEMRILWSAADQKCLLCLLSCKEGKFTLYYCDPLRPYPVLLPTTHWSLDSGIMQNKVPSTSLVSASMNKFGSFLFLKENGAAVWTNPVVI